MNPVENLRDVYTTDEGDLDRRRVVQTLGVFVAVLLLISLVAVVGSPEQKPDVEPDSTPTSTETPTSTPTPTEKPVTNADTGEKYETLHHAVANASEGDTLLVGRGVYQGTADDKYTDDDTPYIILDKSLTIKATSPEARITGDVKIQASNIVLDGFTFDDGHIVGIGVSDVTIQNNTFTSETRKKTSIGFVGTSRSAVTDIVVQNNHFRSSGVAVAKDSRDVTITNNTFNQIHTTGIFLSYAGDRISVTNNVFHGNGTLVKTEEFRGANYTFSGNNLIVEGDGVPYKAVGNQPPLESKDVPVLQGNYWNERNVVEDDTLQEDDWVRLGEPLDTPNPDAGEVSDE